MRKTYFLLLLSVIMSWQFINAFVNPESSWNIDHYLYKPILNEIVTKIENLVIESEQNQEEDVVKSSLSSKVNYAYPVHTLTDFKVYSCTQVENTEGEFIFDLTKISDFLQLNNIDLSLVKFYFSASDFDNDVNYLLANNLNSSYNSTSGSFIYVRITNPSVQQGYDRYEYELKSITSEELILSLDNDTPHFCQGSEGELIITGTPGSTVFYTFDGLTNSVVINQSGIGTIDLGTLNTVGSIPVQFTSIVLGTCTKTLQGISKNIKVISGEQLELTINQYGLACKNSPAHFNVVGTPGATVNYTVTISGVLQSYTYIIPSSGNGTIITPNLAPGSSPRLVVTSMTLGDCSKTLTGSSYTKNISVRNDITATVSIIEANPILCPTSKLHARISYTNATGLTAVIHYSLNGERFIATSQNSPYTLEISMPESIRNSPTTNGIIRLEIDAIDIYNNSAPDIICRTNFSGIFTTFPYYKYFACTLDNILPICLGGEGGNNLSFSNQPSQPNQGSLYCLGSTPNAFWKYFQVSEGGNLSYDIRQTNLNGELIDVDFIAYGPFTGSLNPLDKDNTISSICCQITHMNSLWFENRVPENEVESIVGCSYSASPIEELNLINVRPGEIYVILMTNFNGSNGTISFTENPNSTGATSCDIVCPLYLGEDFELCEGESATLTATIDDATSYTWYRDNVAIPGATSQSYTITEQGTYSVVVVKPGCQSNARASITVRVLPELEYNPIQDKVVCVGETFDLSNLRNELFADPSQYIFTYHLSSGDAFNGLNAYTGDLANYNPTQRDSYLYVAVRTRTSTCPTVIPIHLIKEICNSENPDDIYICNNDERPNFAWFDLTDTIDSIINNSTNPNQNTVTAYLSEENANTQTDPIVDYDNVLLEDNTIVWYRRQSTVDPTDYEIFFNTVFVLSVPNLTSTTNEEITVCLDSPQSATIEGTPGAVITYNINNGTNQTLTLVDGSAIINLGNLNQQTVINITNISYTHTIGENTYVCNKSLNKTITYRIVNPIDFTVSSNVQTCLNAASPIITLTAANGTAPFTVTYTINGGAEQTLVMTSNTYEIQVPTNVEGEYVYNFTSIVGTESISCVTPLDINVNATIYNLPTATLTGDSEACTNDSRTYTISGPANATVVYTINGVNNTVNLGANGEYQFTQVIDQNYTLSLVSIQDQSGCSNVLNNTINVVATNLPVATIAGSTSICNGTSTELIFQGTPNAVVTFSANGQEYTVTIGADGFGRFTTPNLTATTVYNLVSIQGACSNTLTGSATVTVLDLPTATIEGTTQVCLNSAQPTVTFTGANGVAPYTFTYTINGGAPQTVTSTTNSVTVAVPTTAAGVFEYTLVSVSSSTTPACNNTATGSASVTVLELPVASVTASTQVCLGAQVTVNFRGTPNATVTYTIDGVNQTVVLNPDGTQSINVTVNNNVTITLVSVQDVQGCTSALTQSTTITKVDLPVATIAGSTSICNGTSTELTFQGTPNAVVTFTANGQEYTVTLLADGSGRFTTPNLTATTVYSLVSIQGACSNTLTGSATVTVLDLPTATIEGTTQVCLNSAQPTVTFTGANGVAPYTFTYTINGGAPQTVTSTTNSVTVAVPTTAAGVFEYTLVSVSSSTTPACNNTATGSASVTVLELPVASVTASAEVCLGAQGTVNFRGTPNATVTYTIDGVNQTIQLEADGTKAINVTVNNNVTITLVSVQDVQGCTSSLTQSATITKVDLPVATIAGTTSICNGTSAELTFQGTPNAVVTFTANGQEYTVTLLADGSGRFITPNLTATTVYSLVSIQGACSNTLTGSATVTVLDLPTATVIGTQTICNGNNATVQITGTPNATVTYTVNGVTETVVLGNSGSTNVVLNGLTVNTTIQLVSITTNNAVPCTAQVTDQVLVTVIPVPTITDLTAAANTICSGEATGIQIFGNTPDVQFSWTVTTTNGVRGATAGTGNVISQQLTAANTTGTVTYTVTPFIGGCQGVSQQITITVTPIPTLTLSTGNFAICTGATAIIDISSNVDTAFYTWNAVSTNGIEGASGGTGTSISQTLINNSNQVGTVTYTVTPYNGNCQGTPRTVVVTVYPTPTVVATPTEDTICSGNQTNITLTSNIVNTTYTWTVVANGVTGALPGSGSQINQTLSAVGVPGTVQYIITPTVNGCVGEPTTVTVTVTPRPEIFANSNPPAICSESFTGIALSASLEGTTFEWTVVQNGVEGAFAGTGSTINQQLFTLGNTPGTAVYTVTPYANGCAGNPVTITVRVNPLPLPKLKEGYICYDPIKDEVISSYILNSGLSQSNFTFVWMLDGEVIPGANQSTYEVVVGGQYTLVVTNNTTNCTTTQVVNIQESHPAVSATYELSNYFNSAQTLTINVVGTGNYIYQLNDGIPQESNVFTNVLPGTHSVTITDQNGCTYIVIDNITTMQFPNFFTPNGDGINDTWNIWSLENQEDARIFIFDRQGKLIKQISPRGAGWDGTLNGTPLPSTDYWFSVEYYENGILRNFKSHFSLKR